MSEKFKFAPGRPGFGTKGDDGSIGAQGLAMYFTDLDPVSDINLISTKIQNSQVLWSGSSTPLLDGRTYQAGDLFFDSNGKAYEISDPITGAFTSLGGSLNMGGFFVPLGINSDNGFQRYFNSNSSPKYIIDNIYTEAGAINYTEAPLTIYGIDPKDFARVEYSNVQKPGSTGDPLNPFTVYSSGEVGGLDDQKSIAIVRDASHNLFRIGNLDDGGNLRNVNLKFDVSSLIHTKQPGNYFNVNSPLGSVLTNYEIAANTLFDPNFNPSPASFVGFMGTGDASVSWNLLDFTNDSTVTGDLYFFESLAPYTSSTFRIDSSAARPLVFSNIGATGSVRITGLSGSKAYGYYIKLSKNGWIRSSVTKYVYQGNISVAPSGYSVSGTADSANTFTVTSNFTWEASIYQNPGGFMSIGTCTSTAGLNGSFILNVSANTGDASTASRAGRVRVKLLPGGTTYQDVSIYQPRSIAGPEMTLKNNAKLYSYTWPYFDIDVSRNGKAGGVKPFTMDVSSNSAWDIDTLPGWATIYPMSGAAGITPITITVAEDLNIEYQRNGTVTFVTNPGGSPFGYLTLYQRGVEAWAEYSGTRYNFGPPISLDYNSYGNYWTIQGGSPIYTSMLSFSMRFTDGVNLPWFWKTSTLPWLQVTDRTGSGNGYGPTFSRDMMQTPYGYTSIDGSAGNVTGYPFIFTVQGT